MDKITIKPNKQYPLTFDVSQGDKYADSVTYDEMIGLVTSLTMPHERPCLQWMKTKEQHQAWRNRLINDKNK